MKIMRITNITATNFKSFKEINVKLDDFTLIVGANAAGKSNLMSIFKFIRDIVNEGLGLAELHNKSFSSFYNKNKILF